MAFAKSGCVIPAAGFGCENRLGQASRRSHSEAEHEDEPPQLGDSGNPFPSYIRV